MLKCRYCHFFQKYLHPISNLNVDNTYYKFEKLNPNNSTVNLIKSHIMTLFILTLITSTKIIDFLKKNVHLTFALKHRIRMSRISSNIFNRFLCKYRKI